MKFNNPFQTASPTRPPEQPQTGDTDLHFARKFAALEAPKMINISKADIERGCIDIRFWIKGIENERDLEKLQRESNWTAYQEALRLLNQAEAQRDELLAAMERIKSKLGEHEGKGDKRAGELIIDAYFEAKTAIAKCEAQPLQTRVSLYKEAYEKTLEVLKDLLAHHRVQALPDTDTLTPRILAARAAIENYSSL